MSNADRISFNELVERALRDPALSNMRPVIEKELLHYDVLFALDKAGLLDELVFQGGTSLRLCYNANRFSEDLDFVGGAGFSAFQLKNMKQCIEHYIGQRYDLDVSVKEPATLRTEPDFNNLNVNKWQIAITTAPGRPDLPKQRVKVEVANITAHTRNTRALVRNYDFLPDGYEDTLVSVETLDEILADKLISLPATERYVRHRDIWDLAWLTQQKAQPDTGLVLQKVTDYGISDYATKLETTAERLPNIVRSQAFAAEMRRFLPAPVFDRTLGRERFLSYLENTVSGLLRDVQSALNPRPGPEFNM